MPAIYIIHENREWTAPLKVELERLALPHEDWFVDEGALDLSQSPPEGVFYNRMSASSHTRGHRYAPEHAACILAWLEGHGRRVINPGAALRLEVSKVAQYAALEAFGIATPRTIAAVGRAQILEAARRFEGPFITKHNRGGKGAGVNLFGDLRALERHLYGPQFEAPIDGVTLVQEYVRAPEPFITRAEFIGGEFLYALRVDTSRGFELCPADVCNLRQDRPRFRVVSDFVDPIVERYAQFLAASRVDVAGIEFIVDGDGRRYTYDINTNTNYNSAAEREAGIFGMRRLAEYLGEELAALEGAKPARRRA